MKTNLNEIAKVLHESAVNKGFWEQNWSDEHCLALVVTEVAEAIEADRKGKRADIEAFKNRIDRYPELRLLEHQQDWIFGSDFEELIKNTVEDEFADILIRILDLTGKSNIEITVTGEQINKLLTDNEFLKLSFTEKAYILIAVLINDYIELNGRINCSICYVLAWTKKLNIDLEWHIQQKMKYNALRELMHGKKY